MADLVLSGIFKRFGSVEAVAGVSLDCSEGRFMALMGPSGCGKTTLLRLIAGLESADQGSIQIGGRDVTALPPEKRNIGLMFQSYALFPHMTVAGNLAFPMRMRRDFTAAERQRRIARALDLVRLPGVSERYPRQLSGGQQQRVAFARALIDEPDILLLDEPLSNLDARLREEMQLELAELRRQVPVTTILVTHDQSEGLALADEIVVMRGGAIEQAGAPRDVYANPATPFVADFLGGANVLSVAILPGPGGSWTLRFRDGAEFSAPAGFAAKPGSANLVIRQEHIRLFDERAPADIAVQASIAAVAFRGAFAQIAAEAFGQRLRIAAPPGDAPKPGERLRIGWQLKDCKLIPADAEAET